MPEDNNDSIIDGGGEKESDSVESGERNIIMPEQTSVLLQSFRNIPDRWSLDAIQMADYDGNATMYPAIEFVDSEEKAKVTVVPYFQSDSDNPADAFGGYVLIGYITPQLDELYNVSKLADNTVVITDSAGDNLIQLEFSVLGNIGEISRLAIDIMNKTNALKNQ
jgi:hypothetical protein